MLSARQENERTLARFAGISEEEAATRLSYKVAVICADPPTGLPFSGHLRGLLGFTLDVVDEADQADLVVVVNAPAPQKYQAALYVAITNADVTITRASIDQRSEGVPHDLCAKLAACYAASVVIAHAIGGDHLAHLTLPLKVPFARLGVTSQLLEQTVHLRDTVLAGAGGVGSGFVWALESLDVRGTLDIVDPKTVTSGGLNRCHHYSAGDLGKNKAEALAANAALPNVERVPFVGTFGDLRSQRFRIKRVIVTVDSRPARRAIQSELPLEVLDASTTDASAIVIHSHAEPNNGACLSCIYHHIPLEDERNRSIAAGLGLDYAEIAGKERIDSSLAQRLADLHGLDAGGLEGQALSSLHKELCAAQVLKMPGGEQALAPFAFISNLAGALLAVELLRIEADAVAAREGSDLSLDPWSPPHARARRRRTKRPDCEFCSDREKIAVLDLIWKDTMNAAPTQNDKVG